MNNNLDAHNVDDGLELERGLQKIAFEIFSEVKAICDRNNIKYYLIEGSLLGAVRHKGFIPWDDDIDMAVFNTDMPKFLECCRRELPDHLYIEGAFDKDRLTTFERGLTKVYHKNYKIVDIAGRKRNQSVDVLTLIGLPNGKLAQKLFYYRMLIRKSLGKMCRPEGIATQYWYNQTPLRKFAIKLAKTIDFNKLISYERQYDILEKYVNKYPPEKSKYIMAYPSAYKLNETVPSDCYGDGVTADFENLKVNIPEKYDEILTHLYGDYMQLPPEDKRKGTHIVEHIHEDENFGGGYYLTSIFVSSALVAHAYEGRRAA